MASTMASTLALSRPSEKLGTHSTSVLGMARRITGGGWVRQLWRECTVMRWSDGRLARLDSRWPGGDARRSTGAIDTTLVEPADYETMRCPPRLSGRGFT